MTDLFLDAPAPQPLRRPAAQDAHGEHWEDPYAWLRDDALPTLTDSAVRRHLEAENAIPMRCQPGASRYCATSWSA